MSDNIDLALAAVAEGMGVAEASRVYNVNLYVLYRRVGKVPRPAMTPEELALLRTMRRRVAAHFGVSRQAVGQWLAAGVVPRARVPELRRFLEACHA